MSSARIRAVAAALALFAFARWLNGPFNPAIEGTVQDDAGPVAFVRVGVQGACERVRTDKEGRFHLPTRGRPGRVIATKPGYRIASAEAEHAPIQLLLVRLPNMDHEDYAWIDPHPDPLARNNCGNCHGEIYREWLTSAHARSATNSRFLSLYAGGDRKTPVHKVWNARHEHPDGAAVCAACHAPTFTSPTLEYDVREADGVHKSGIHCDYCHKVAAAPADKFGTRFGRDALELLRPATGDALAFGPLDDAVRPGESFAHAPIYKDSRYCASCHEGVVFGVHAYGTYSEWLESPAKAQGKQCQDCHMAPTGKLTNIAPGKGGIERNPRTLASHATPGGQYAMLRRAVSLKLKVTEDDRGSLVEVAVLARDVGHRVPTGFPDRHLILVVAAEDASGNPVESVDGPRLRRNAGQWSGSAGMVFGKQLIDDRGRTPIPFWLHVDKIEDTRLRPDRPERHTFRFPPSARRVTARLWYRRFWQEVADLRGWKDNDLLVAEEMTK